MKPRLIDGGLAVDDRGCLRFVNDFDFKDVKRFYQVENNKGVIRAFHGHLREAKYAYVVKGTAKIIIAEMGVPLSLKNPKFFVLSDKKPQILYIPEGYANGMKMLEDNTIIVFFSTSAMEEAKTDDYRFKWDCLGEGIWETENR